MNRSRIAILALLSVFLFGSNASAQDMSFGIDEASEEAEVSDEPAADEEGEAEGTTEAGADFDVIGELAAEEDDLAAGPIDTSAAKTKEVTEEIYAVQQIYALRKRRIELAPSFGFTVNDPFISHPSVGAALNYWITNVLAVGANFNWYQGFESESDVNFNVRRATRLATRPTEFQVGFWGNFTYVPLYGKFAFFNKNIFQWDAYVIGGVGALRTRPVAVVNPEFRSFDYNFRLGFNVGLGLRIFLSKWLTVFAELRDYIYFEKLESLDVSLDNREDPDTWLEDSSSLINNVTVQVGITLFFPFTFEYKLPK